MREYTIQELSDLTGVARRTIHFYTQQEIIPPPEGAGLSTRYQQIHLVRLKLIPFLRQEGLRLDQIRSYFKIQDLAELEKRLENAEAVLNAEVREKPATFLKGTSLINFSLPQGISLLVPEEFSVKDPDRVIEIIQTIQKLIEK